LGQTKAGEVAVDIRGEEIDATTHLFKLGESVYTYPPGGLRERVDELIDSGKTHFLMDLSELTFDEDLRLVVMLDEAVNAAGGSVAYVCSESVGRVFEITGLDKRLAVYGSRQEALAAIGSHTQRTPPPE
jgi:anti-anti-sigma regulatory factor